MRTRWNSEAEKTLLIILSGLSSIVDIVMHFSCEKMPGKQKCCSGNAYRDVLLYQYTQCSEIYLRGRCIENSTW